MESITSLVQRFEETKRRATMYAALAEVLAEQLQAQQRMEELVVTYPEINAESFTAVAGTTQSASSPKRTPKVAIYTAILKSHGKPMHVSEILAAAQSRGVVPRGTTNPPQVQLRNALFSSKNRFYNVGDNTWWLVGEPLPEDSPRDSTNECRHAVVQEEAEHALTRSETT